MKSLWNKNEFKKFTNDSLGLRVYTSRLLGRELDLVLHGGGNTSVKTRVKNIFGEEDDILYIKGSGWDLATIESQGFAPVKLKVLKQMAGLESLSDSAMVKLQRAAMTDPYAPNPSVEAILHAIIPFKFVDHTHADAVVTITNSPNGKERIQEIYGSRALIVPYVMPGFILAKKIYEMTKNLNWLKIESIILMNHGVFTFHDEGKKSYERMIDVVSQAENYLKKQKAVIKIHPRKAQEDFLELAKIRREVSQIAKSPMLAVLNQEQEAVHFSNLPRISPVASRGPLTPDHVIRTKRIPVILGKNPEENLKHFVRDYREYFKQNTTGKKTMLDSAPRWAVWPGYGLIYFSRSVKEAAIIKDIVEHTMKAIQQAEMLGGWRALSEKDIFDVEYWELEQAKLKKGDKLPILQGKIALVTGAASGIGKACVENLVAQGACVAALDINSNVKEIFSTPHPSLPHMWGGLGSGKSILSLVYDVTNEKKIKEAIEQTIRNFGGLDIVVSNAGIFPPSAKLAEMKQETWQKSLDINLTSHQALLKNAIPYLSQGINPTVIIVGSKNVPAPGPGAGAYSVAKAGLTQMARVAALELAPLGIRVNVIHPNQVFDTAIWTKEVLERRAQAYKMSVEEYKKSNLLKTEITSQDVAQLVCSLAGPAFTKTTGVQIPIDGGNERVI